MAPLTSAGIRPTRWIGLTAGDLSKIKVVSSLSETVVPRNEVWGYIIGHLWPDDYKGRLETIAVTGCIFATKWIKGKTPMYMSALTNGVAKKFNNGDSEDWAGLVRLILKYSVCQFLTTGLTEYRNALYSHTVNRAQKRMALEMFNSISHSEVDFVLRNKPGELSSMIIQSSRALRGFLTNIVQRIIPTSLDIYQTQRLIGKLNQGRCAGISKLTLTSYVMWSLFYGNRRATQRIKMDVQENLMRGQMQRSLQNAENVRLLDTATLEEKLFEHDFAAYGGAVVGVQESLALMNTIQKGILRSGLLMSMLRVTRDIYEGRGKAGDLAAVTQMFHGISRPLNFVGTIYREFKTNYNAISQGLRIMKLTKMADKADAKSLLVNNGSIQLRNVSFCYPASAESPVLKNISLSIPGKAKIAIVGPSGGGKSTLLKLIARLYDPNNGSIAICGQDISNVTLRSLRASMAMLPQNTLLFNSSMRENILYGVVTPVEEEKLIDVLTSCGLLTLYQKVGLDAMLGEGGFALSGGERQKIALARAMLRDSPIILLDEPATGLDAENEKSVMTAIKRAFHDKTVLIVAHKLATITDCDEIIYVNDGLIVERGTHNELIKKGGFYNTLWESQLANYSIKSKVEESRPNAYDSQSCCEGCCQ